MTPDEINRLLNMDAQLDKILFHQVEVFDMGAAKAIAERAKLGLNPNTRIAAELNGCEGCSNFDGNCFPMFLGKCDRYKPGVEKPWKEEKICAAFAESTAHSFDVGLTNCDCELPRSMKIAASEPKEDWGRQIKLDRDAQKFEQSLTKDDRGLLYALGISIEAL